MKKALLKNQIIEKQLIDLYQEEKKGRLVTTCNPLPSSGSDRQYFRLIDDIGGTLLGVYHTHTEENQLFIELSKRFATLKLPAPKVYSSASSSLYLVEDLGDQTLFHFLQGERARTNESCSDALYQKYKEVLSILAKLQTQTLVNYDLKTSHPTFAGQNMRWDFYYFKYCFLNTTKVVYDEYQLEADFDRLVAYLEQAPTQDLFLFRDCQSRNVMLNNGQVYFIDYQGGREGAVQYDIASLLYQARANLSNEVRTSLKDYYVNELQKYRPDVADVFDKYYKGFVLLRQLQVLGAYGMRGMREKKAHFVASVPYALNNLRHLLAENSFGVELPYLTKILNQMIETKKPKLTVNIKSFSYRREIPQDPTSHGGGFVFDCRFIPNPGRQAEYRDLNGLDKPVRDYLKAEPLAKEFLASMKNITQMAVQRYVERDFDHLMISCGCTGGQHRSIFFASSLATYLQEQFPLVNFKIQHIEEEHRQAGTSIVGTVHLH